MLVDNLQITLTPQATEILIKLGINSNNLDKTPFENRVSSRFLSNTKSTQEKTFDTNSIKKKNYKH